MVYIPSAIILLIGFQDTAALSHDLKFFVCTRKCQLESAGFDERVLKNTFNKHEGQGTTGQCV